MSSALGGETSPAVSSEEAKAEILGFDPTRKKKRSGASAASKALHALELNPPTATPAAEESGSPAPSPAEAAAEGGSISERLVASGPYELSAAASANVSLANDETADYDYKFLLARICQRILADKSSDALSGRKRSIEPPEVGKVGTKRIAWVNFVNNCGSINRKPEHVLEFVLTELGASGSIAGDNKLIIKGRFQGKQLETVLRRYIAEYVACRTCRSGNTDLRKENRIWYKVCKDCGASPSVANIKQGFRAQARRRKP